MLFRFEVEAEVERITGLFASREELEEEILGELESADPSQISGGEGGEYEVVSWSVNSVAIEPVLPMSKRVDRILPLVQVLTGAADRNKAKVFLELADTIGVKSL